MPFPYRYETHCCLVAKAGAYVCGACKSHEIVALQDLTSEHLRSFKETWQTAARATGNNIARLKRFFKFCLENEWLARNPAIALRRGKHVEHSQKLPFTEDEMQRIVLAADKATPNAMINFLLVTLILITRHCGLRISDAALLKGDS